jgi:hypothetical protein
MRKRKGEMQTLVEADGVVFGVVHNVHEQLTAIKLAQTNAIMRYDISSYS